MLTGKPQARFGFDISLYESVEVLVDIHPLVQYAHHINQVGAGNPVVQRVRSNSVLTLAVVKDEWVGAGQTILPCDLNTFWDPRTTKRADKFIVDSIDEHELFAEMGYFPDGLPTIVAETGEVLADVVAGRENPDQLIVNSNIGMAVCDVVVGKAIYDRALAQNAGILLLDEPGAHLDLRHQIELFDLLRRLARERQVAVVLSLVGQIFAIDPASMGEADRGHA